MDLILICFLLTVHFVNVYANKVLLFSMDGFRWDYISKVKTPNFDRLAEIGTRAEFINNTFITKTFPSHYTVATGLYEESHGIIGNGMYDPYLNRSFNKGSREPEWWNGGEPIWITAKRNGLKSATYFWPGSEVKIRGLRPDIYVNYTKVNVAEQIDTVIEWLTKKDIDMVVMYTPQPDKAGHKYGPNSREVLSKVEEMDNVLGYLMQKFENNKLFSSVNLILTSDHGMTDIDFKNKRIEITSLVSADDIIRHSDRGPIMHITPVDGREDAVIKALNNNPNMTVYRKSDIPEFWHYKNSPRIMPVLCVAEEGWSILWDSDDLITNTDKGNHGYDNRLMTMKPIFYAAGPNIRENYEATPFLSVDIYPLICAILGIPESPNNGSLTRVKSFLVLSSQNGTNSAINDATNGARSEAVLSVHSSINMFVAMIYFHLQILFKQD